MNIRRISRNAILASSVIVALLLAVSPVFSQDAPQVLRLSVGYRTLKNSTTMTPEKRKEVEALEAQARAASNEGKFGDALRYYYQAMSVLRDQAWTPSRALETALVAKSERVIVDPGDTVHLSLTQSFALTDPVKGTLNGTVAIGRLRNNQQEPIAEIQKLSGLAPDFKQKPLDISAKVPDLPDGPYSFIITLNPDGGEPIVKTANVRIARGVNGRSNEIAAGSRALATELKSKGKDDLLRALAPVDYASKMIDLANKGEIQVDRSAFSEDLSRASTILSQLAKGENPLRTLRGDFRWAYFSAVDNTIQPFRVFVPSNYDASKKYPLVIALHGMGGDENSYFVGYDNGIIKREAEARGYLVACPKGRGSASMYMGSAERDVIDVVTEMKRNYSIDPERVYLTGHSMGGYGTWSVATSNPDLFAAIAPFAGGGSPLTVSKLAAIASVPEFVVHGDADPTVPVEESRKMVKAAKAVGANVKYTEVPGGNHINIVVPYIKDMFDWFDTHARQSKGAKAASAN